MKQGALFFDETADRYDIRFDLADYYGGLHCGECLEVFTGGKWKPTRIRIAPCLSCCFYGLTESLKIKSCDFSFHIISPYYILLFTFRF